MIYISVADETGVQTTTVKELDKLSDLAEIPVMAKIVPAGNGKQNIIFYANSAEYNNFIDDYFVNHTKYKGVGIITVSQGFEIETLMDPEIIFEYPIKYDEKEFKYHVATIYNPLRSTIHAIENRMAAKAYFMIK